MARIIDWPECLGVSAIEYPAEPAVLSAGQNTSSSNFFQTFRTLGELLEFNVTFSPRQGAAARQVSGRISALLSGANAIRFPLIDPNRRKMTTSAQNWSHGLTWSNGSQWAADFPHVGVQNGQGAGSNLVLLAAEHWGRSLSYGDWIGFGPNHFGAYKVIGLQGNGYRIWPTLRSAITNEMYATLKPVVLARTFPGGSRISQTGWVSSQSLSLVEVLDSQKSNFVDLI